MKLFLFLLLFINSLAYAAQCAIPKPFKAITDDLNTYQYDNVIRSLQNTSNNQQSDDSTLTSQPIIINFWASWCAPCREELPLLANLAKEEKAIVELINIEDTPEEAQALLNDLNVQNLPNYYAEYELLSTLKIAGLPATLVYSENQVFLGVGVLKSESEISQWLACLSTP